MEPKTFSKIRYLAVVFWILLGVIFLAVFADMESSESRLDFRCGVAKSENIDVVRKECYEKYEEQYNKFGFPVYGFVILNFVLIIFVCVIYSQILRPTVNRLSRSIRNGDPERQENALSTGYKLFIAYCCQLSTRLVLGIIFIILQTQLLYPLRLSSKFHCYLTDGTTQPRNSSDNAQHSTLHNCHNQRAVKTNSWMDAVLVVNGIFVAGILIEIVYIFFRACRERDFMQNSKFQTSHLNPPEESRQQEERVQIVINIPHEIQQQERTEHEINIPHLPSGPEQLLKSPLQEFIQNTKKMIMDDTYQPPQLQSLFPSPPGKGHPPKHLTLDQIYTNLVVVPGMADNDFTEDRRKNLEIYTRSVEKNERPRKLEDILNHENKNVLIVGRPGIGKTLCCSKILRDWASSKVFNQTSDKKIHFDAAFFVKFRTLNTATDLSLRELLTRSTYSPRNELDEEVWNYILENPQKVLLIFDGIDEFKDNSKIGTENKKPQFKNSVDEKMPLSALYAKLTTGKLLKGAAVLTTTRPTALSCTESIRFDKIFEILGFSSEQVEEYVTKFAEEDKEAGDTVKRHITSNINILSLCYIPASCFIICSSLFKMVKFYAPKSLNLPTSLTDIYKRAVKIFYLRHNEEFRNKHFTRKDFESDDLPPEEEKKLEKLGKMAFEGIKEGRLIFGGNEVRGMEDSALFHRLPDHEPDPFNSEGQFCFIHLTMQEFFAAKHLSNMSETELRNFVSENIKEVKWQLVFQFLAGLLENKNHLPSEIITDHLPMKTKGIPRDDFGEHRDDQKWKVNSWPTENEQYLAVTLIKCVNENSRMKLEVQRKLQQINLKCVTFSSCHLTAVDCSSLVNVINVQQISHLDLTGNNFGPLGCLQICKLLKCRESQLSWLDLTRNQLTDEAAKYLAEAINNNNCQLRTLNLRANNISHIGAQHLAEAINNNNCQLHTLNLTNNNISDIGAQHLAEAINNNNNCQLRLLYLSANKISDIGAQHLAEAINNNNCQLRMLNLLYNSNITEAGKQHARSLQSNSQSKCKLIL